VTSADEPVDTGARARRTRRPRPLEPFDRRGQALWRAIAGAVHPEGDPVYVLRPDELQVLESACHQLDRADRLMAEVDAAGTTMTPGSAGQQVLDGRVTEARLLEVAARGALLALKLPDVVAGAAGPATLREHQANAAAARWGRSGGGPRGD